MNRTGLVICLICLCIRAVYVTGCEMCPDTARSILMTPADSMAMKFARRTARAEGIDIDEYHLKGMTSNDNEWWGLFERMPGLLGEPSHFAVRVVAKADTQLFRGVEGVEAGKPAENVERRNAENRGPPSGPSD